jgi:hypothetical protein
MPLHDGAARGSPGNQEDHQGSRRRCIIERRFAASQVNGTTFNAHEEKMAIPELEQERVSRALERFCDRRSTYGTS